MRKLDGANQWGMEKGCNCMYSLVANVEMRKTSFYLAFDTQFIDARSGLGAVSVSLLQRHTSAMD